MKNYKRFLSFFICIIICFATSCRSNKEVTANSASSYIDSSVKDQSSDEQSVEETVESSSEVQSSDSSVVESSEPSNVAPPISVPSENSSKNQTVIKENISYNQKKAIWISFLEYMDILTGKSEIQFTSSIKSMFDKCVKEGFNTVIVHARSHGDAYYKSRYYPASVYFTGKRQNTFPFDPLEIMVREAHIRKLKIEAWINPYRGNTITDSFAENDPIQKWIGTSNILKYTVKYNILNPGEPQVRELVINGVMEIVDNYDIDGIHFDDYFYPSTDPTIDYDTYQKYGKGMTLNQFRTDSVNKLISELYSRIKSKKNISFGISPSGNVKYCKNVSCADVETWGKSNKYVDYIAPQLYWDYDEGTLPFQDALSSWEKVVTNSNVKLIPGLAAYRVGNALYAPYWNSGNVLSRQINDSKSSPNYGGFIMFRYQYYFSDQLITERKNLSDIMKN